MIPICARRREREALEHRPYSFDGSAVEKLETAVSAYHGCRFTVAFNTPESAMTAALVTAGVNSGDAVIAGAMAPQHHYNALARLQADIRYCDIGLDGTLYPKALESLAREEIKAAAFAHFEGIRSASPGLPETAVIEDITASLTPFTVTRTTVWSLETVMPEGVEKTGFLLTDDQEAAETAKRFRNSGRKDGVLWNYDLLLKGSDAALSALTASVALHQMETLGTACDRRAETASRLDGLLGTSTLFDRLSRSEDDAPNTYAILLTPQLYCPKEDIFSAIEENGVEAAVCCKPVYKTRAYRDDGIRLSVTEDFYKALLQLPCHHRLNLQETERIAESVREATGTYAYRGCRF